MLGCGIAPKGCATRPGRPALALDRDAAAKQVTVMPLWQNRASTAEFRLNQATSCEDVIVTEEGWPSCSDPSQNKHASISDETDYFKTWSMHTNQVFDSYYFMTYDLKPDSGCPG